MRAPRCIFLLFLFCFACVEPYSPKVNLEDTNSLVIDGYIDSGGNAIIRLSRSLPLYSFADFPAEQGATVTIQSSGGENFKLAEATSGQYTATGLPVNQTSKYSLHIVTSKGNEYVSDDIQIHPTPTIARVYFGVSPTGQEIHVKVDTHDVNPDGTGYYAWESIETYEYQMSYFSRYKRVNGIPHLRLRGEFVDTCWRDEHIPIVTTTTKQLSTNFISGKVISVLPKQSPKISIRYSILVRMRSIEEPEFNYRELLAKMDNQQASIFATIPGPVVGNIHSITNKNEFVLGYFRGQEVKEKRFFIDNSELPSDFQGEQVLPFGCDLDTTCPTNQPPSGPNQCIDVELLGDTKIIISAIEYQNYIVYTYTPNECGDCRVKGGTTIRPLYW